MNDVVIKRRQWRLLKGGHSEYAAFFKSLEIKPFQRYAMNRLIGEAGVNHKSVHQVQTLTHKFPDELSVDEVDKLKFSVEVGKTLILYFFDDIDWAKIQILR